MVRYNIKPGRRGKNKQGMAATQAHQFSVERPSKGQELVVSTRWRRIKTWLNYGIILISVVQLILACVQAANEGGSAMFWEILGPVVS
jgi:hypothetical protein